MPPISLLVIWVSSCYLYSVCHLLLAWRYFFLSSICRFDILIFEFLCYLRSIFCYTLSSNSVYAKCWGIGLPCGLHYIFLLNIVSLMDIDFCIAVFSLNPLIANNRFLGNKIFPFFVSMPLFFHILSSQQYHICWNTCFMDNFNFFSQPKVCQSVITVCRIAQK
jgi:hypothetical protein